jgi:hypothetical protein
MKPSSLVPAALLAIAAILGLLVTISLPSVPFFDVVRVSSRWIYDVGWTTWTRWGIWGSCGVDASNDFSCFHGGLGYDIDTLGLVVHVVAFACTAIALGLAFLETTFMSLSFSKISHLRPLLHCLNQIGFNRQLPSGTPISDFDGYGHCFVCARTLGVQLQRAAPHSQN